MTEITDDDIVEVVDEFADELDPARVSSEAKRLGLSIDELMRRVTNEVKARMSY